MTETSAPARDEWAQSLDQLTKDREGDLVTIDVVDPAIGDQEEVERLPFTYANYDWKDNVVVVAVGGNTARYPVVLRHIVSEPVEVTISELPGDGAAVRIVDDEGTVTLVSLYRPTETTTEPT